MKAFWSTTRLTMCAAAVLLIGYIGALESTIISFSLGKPGPGASAQRDGCRSRVAGHN